MALQSSGTISLSQVNVELGLSATAVISLNDAAVRALFQVGSGGIALSNGYGKSNTFTANIVISSDRDGYNLYNIAVGMGWNPSEKANISVVINSGVYVYSSTTATPAFTVGTFPAGSNINITNNGTIAGMGGAGGAGGGGAGQPGGGAFLAQTSVTLTNNNIIAGGGGGGGSGGATGGCGYAACYNYVGGGGGGGQSGRSNSAGGAGAAPLVPAGASATSGLAGNPGTVSGPGNGGAGSQTSLASLYGGSGGGGGTWGASGNTGVISGNSTSGAAGGAGGYCTSGSGYISWAATGSRYGGII